jgi:hypothetical protein
MGPLSCMRSVVDRNVIMRGMTVQHVNETRRSVASSVGTGFQSLARHGPRLHVVMFHIVSPSDTGPTFCSRLRSFPVRLSTFAWVQTVDTLSLNVVIQWWALVLSITEVSGSGLGLIRSGYSNRNFVVFLRSEQSRDNAANKPWPLASVSLLTQYSPTLEMTSGTFRELLM